MAEYTLSKTDILDFARHLKAEEVTVKAEGGWTHMGQ